MGLVLLYLTLALALSFLCSILEAVLLSTPMSYISTKEKTHGKSAILLKKFKQDIDRPIAVRFVQCKEKEVHFRKRNYNLPVAVQKALLPDTSLF